MLPPVLANSLVRSLVALRIESPRAAAAAAVVVVVVFKGHGLLHRAGLLAQINQPEVPVYFSALCFLWRPRMGKQKKTYSSWPEDRHTESRELLF